MFLTLNATAKRLLQHDMLRALQRYEGQQRTATLIETFPLTMRRQTFHFKHVPLS